MGSVRFALEICWGGLRRGPGSEFDHNTSQFYILYYYILLYYIYFLYINFALGSRIALLIPRDPKILFDSLNWLGHY